MQVGNSVINKKVPQYGVGQVTAIDSRYITVYYGDIDKDCEYQKTNNPLEKINGQHPGNRASREEKSTLTMNSVPSSNRLDVRVQRDTNNTSLAVIATGERLQSMGTISENADITGASKAARLRRKARQEEIESLRVIRDYPYHGMAEVVTVTSNRGKQSQKEQLIYANEHTRVNVSGLGKNKVNILAWTHPIVQLAFSGDLREENDINAKGYTLQSVTPLARAKFSQLLPQIAGLYEPGGPVQSKGIKKKKTGLKAVKLDMTKEQVDAFLGKMNGMMLVSGAPGSGKTTVAMQRIRFLYDQQGMRQEELKNVEYSPELTKIFLANQNLIDYSKEMLEKELQISSSVVELVKDFTGRYLSDIWTYKNKAKLRKKRLLFHEERGRKAFFGLCNVSQLKDCWLAYEYQIAERLALVEDADWFLYVAQALWKETTALSEQIIKFSNNTKVSSYPTASSLNMDALYERVKKTYEKLRDLHRNQGSLKEFDLQFQQWLYWVYDPLDGIKSYFIEEAYAGKVRIKAGIAARIDENEIIDKIKTDWKKRTYGQEEEPWLAFLLRFALSVETDYQARFRDVANPLDITNLHSGKQWTHIMVDEAQDLCVAEAALLGSFVHRHGAFTVSADFHQVVSPVWGMEDSDAFNIGSSLAGGKQLFPFARNMRQSKQIGIFLREFYKSAFGEIATFEANTTIDIRGGNPLLMLGSSSGFPAKIKQRLAVMKRNADLHSIALLQINEDEKAMEQLRAALEECGVQLAPIWAPSDKQNRLITTSVERIKGLEYDACFVVGMDDIDTSALKYSKNRAYVALSRPALQLTILCEEIPEYLQKIPSDYINIINI